MFERMADLAIYRSRLVLVVAALAVALMGVVGAGAFDKLKGGGFDDPASPSTRAANVIADKFGGETNLVLLVRSDGPVDAPAAEEDGRSLVAELRQDDRISNVVSYWETDSPDLRGEDGRQALVLAHVKGDSTAQRENAVAILDTYSGAYEDTLTVRAGGGAAVGADLSNQVVEDLILAEAIALPLTLLLLLIVFGSVVAALLPLAIAVIAIIGSFAQLFLLGSVTDVADTATNLTTSDTSLTS